MDCLFCNLDKKDYIYEDDNVFVVKDVRPTHEIHYLIIPKKHIESINHLKLEDRELMGELMLTAQKIAKEKKLEGYKLKINVGRKGGQIIDHLHIHLLGGNKIWH
ncbi:HIT domain-containing protein [Patescibacteria group bacterium]|nr:HIT domain-containing protein [Patescibacteria group bacterium]